MALKTITDPKDAPLDPLRTKTVAVLGFGNQGAAHALNLRDSGITVIVGTRSESAGSERAAACGFDPLPIEEAVEQGDLLIIALPDEAQPEIWTQRIEPRLRTGSTIGFLHGFTIRFGGIQPSADVGIVMVAPKGPGTALRGRYEQGYGIPCLLAVHQESPHHDAENLALAWAAGIGCIRAAIVFTTFADETETDLFGEQAVLCGGITELILAAFETLVAAGYAPELAYMECCQEAKQIADLIFSRGLAETMSAISNTAEFGAYNVGPTLIDHGVRERMQHALGGIRDGSFARDLAQDHAAGFPRFRQQRQALRDHPIEEAGAAVRQWLPWLAKRQRD